MDYKETIKRIRSLRRELRTLEDGLLDAMAKDACAEVALPPDIKDIQELCANHFGESIHVMRSPVRTDRLSMVRGMAMVLCQNHTPHRVSDIARAFNRGHSSVWHWIRQARNRIECDKRFSADYAALDRVLTYKKYKAA